jgi:hypothetical protein
MAASPTGASIDLYWLPLGAGGHSVRINGLIFEAVSARLQHRSACALYHSALDVRSNEARYVIEMAPVWNEDAEERGVVARGVVGSNLLRRWPLFQYEIRCWRDGHIPDIAEAVDSPRRLSDEPQIAAAILRLAPAVPTPVWGRDELGGGEMWNSNSVTAWLIAGSGIDPTPIAPPAGGRAPGWNAGLALAHPLVGRGKGTFDRSGAQRTSPVGLAPRRAAR